MSDRAVNERPDGDASVGDHDEDRGADHDRDGLDFRGSRRLVGFEEWFWYVAAAVSYIVLGIWHKWLLNWFVGPAWLIAFVVIGPWLTDRIGLTGRTRSSP